MAKVRANPTALIAVKVAHTIAWAFFVGCILAIPVMSWRGNHEAAAWLIGIVLLEVAVLLLNGWRCPLTSLAARFTDERHDNFDIYLPLWLARHNKLIFGIVFCAGLAFAAFNVFSLPVAQAADATAQQFPDVLGAKVQARGADTFDFDVTVSSPYDTAQRYADGFRVSGPDGMVFGERKLWHDHASEQPFTRDLYGVKIPRAVRKVVVQARDQRHGYGGKAVEVALPQR